MAHPGHLRIAAVKFVVSEFPYCESPPRFTAQ